MLFYTGTSIDHRKADCSERPENVFEMHSFLGLLVGRYRRPIENFSNKQHDDILDKEGCLIRWTN